MAPSLSTGLDLEEVRGIVAARARERGGMMAVLEAIQNRFGFLPEASLRAVAEESRRSLVDIYGIASFYRFFSLRPRGKHLICACLGTACHVRGGPRIVEEIERQLEVVSGQTTPDGEFTLETVNCLGVCALGPVVVVDGRYFSKVKKSRVRQLLDGARDGSAGKAGPEVLETPVPDVGCPHCHHGLMDDAAPVDGLPSIRLVASAGASQGWVRLSSMLGSGRFTAEPAIPLNGGLRLFCPHCGRSLVGEGTCPECEVPMASLACRRGGILQVCARLGCRGVEFELP